MTSRTVPAWRLFLCFLLTLFFAPAVFAAEGANFSYAEYPLERAGVALHLDRVALEDAEPQKDILLIHGLTYSSHEFDVDYKDYSLVRKLAREGYAVWRLDIAGYGRSGKVEDGFMPNSDYAAEDINAAVEKISSATGRDKLDVLGWSWGTITVGRFLAAHPEHIRKAVLYAPVFRGIGESEVTEPFHHNTWEDAVEDFQRAEDGSIDDSITEPELVGLWASGCWRYDGDSSPNGGRRDACVAEDVPLFDVSKISVPTLMICGDKDPYIRFDDLRSAKEILPPGSDVEVIEGGAHAVLIEEPYYRDFQNRLVRFLEKE